MNASTMADKITPEEGFRDYQFTSRAIDTIQSLHSQQELFMVGLGFKLPHLAVHVPFKYFDLYRHRQHMWKRRRKELKFPNSAPIVSHKCCAGVDFEFMNKDGGEKFTRKENIGRMNSPFTQQMHTELVLTYCNHMSLLLHAAIYRLIYMCMFSELGVCCCCDLFGCPDWSVVG